MPTRISEADLASVSLNKFEEVIAAKPGDDSTAVTVFRLRVMPKFYGRDTEATASGGQLIIEVPDPESPETQKRLRDAVTLQMGGSPKDQS